MYAAVPRHDSELLQHLINLYPEAIHVVDRNGRLPLHEACESARPILGSIRNLVEADSFTVLEKTLDGRSPYQLVWRLNRRNPDIERYLVEKQDEVVNAMKEAFEDVADAQLGLPDLVIARVWSFTKPDLWQPPRRERDQRDGGIRDWWE
jgi:predicted NAD/FAD-dependent oxidoreductase